MSRVDLTCGRRLPQRICHQIVQRILLRDPELNCIARVVAAGETCYLTKRLEARHDQAEGILTPPQNGKPLH